LSESSYQKIKRYKDAMADYLTAVKLAPDSSEPHNGLAWLLATCPDASVREGTKAVIEATRACELSRWKSAGDMDTLAAAHAEAGDFAEAVKREQEAIHLTAPDDPSRAAFQARLALYQAKTPYRDESPGR
jgi:cytochrome c-type biogenesis protein CcmH/NrfG